MSQPATRLIAADPKNAAAAATAAPATIIRNAASSRSAGFGQVAQGEFASRSANDATTAVRTAARMVAAETSNLPTTIEVIQASNPTPSGSIAPRAYCPKFTCNAYPSAVTATAHAPAESSARAATASDGASAFLGRTIVGRAAEVSTCDLSALCVTPLARAWP